MAPWGLMLDDYKGVGFYEDGHVKWLGRKETNMADKWEVDPDGKLWRRRSYVLKLTDYVNPNSVAELVADANRGAESAAYDKAIDRAAERATDEAFKLSQAALAHGLVRDAIGILAGEHLRPGKAPDLNSAQAVINLACAAEALARSVALRGLSPGPPPGAYGVALPPQPLEEAIAEAHGLTLEGAEE